MWLGLMWCAIGSVAGTIEVFWPVSDPVVHRLILIEHTVEMCLGYLIYRVAKLKEVE